MNCPYCASITTNEHTQKTTLGSRTFRCSPCQRRFNERTGTPFNFLEYIPLMWFCLSSDRTGWCGPFFCQNAKYVASRTA